MSSIVSVGNPRASQYAAMARKASSRGSKRFVFTAAGDDLQPFPAYYARRAWRDNPLASFWPWLRYRWMFHDFRMFGIMETLRKQYYIGEAWRRRDERIFAGKDDNGNKYWISRRAGNKMGGRLFEPADPHWFRGQDQSYIPAGHYFWWVYMRAHNPTQEKARGECGYNTHGVQRSTPWTIEWGPYMPHAMGDKAPFDPWMAHQPGLLFNPQYEIFKEAGFSGWTTQTARPTHQPFYGEHDIDEDVILAYYRRMPWHMKSSHPMDGDEWRLA